MKQYRVKDEYIDLYSNDAEFAADPVIDENELSWLAREWEMTMDEIMRQVDEIE